MLLTGRTFSASIKGSLDICAIPNSKNIVISTGKHHIGEDGAFVLGDSLLIENQIIDAESLWQDRGRYEIGGAK